MSQEKTIRFIDTNYRTLFTLPDGGNLRMTFPDGKSKVSRCRYVDEYHTEVAGRVYHICEFAGHMERGGIACAPEEPLPRQTDKQALQRRPPLLKRLREPRPAQTERKPVKAEQER